MAIHDSNTGAKGTLYRGNYEPAEWSVGDKKVMGWKEETQTGTDLTFEDTYNDNFLSAKIEGKTEVKSEWQNKEAESTQVQTAQGKNLLDLDRTPADAGAASNTTIRTFSDRNYYIGLTRNNHSSPSAISDFSINNNQVSFKTSLSWYGVGFPIRCTPNTIYTFSAHPSKINSGFGFYTAAGEFISETVVATFTTPLDCYWVLVCLVPVINTLTTFEYPQLELGSTATTYESFVPNSPSPNFHQPITTTIPAGKRKVQDWKGDWYEFTLPRDLHGIGDVRDAVEFDRYSHSGFLRSGMGIKVFDGTESFNFTVLTNTVQFSHTLNMLMPNTAVLCTQFKFTRVGDVSDIEHITTSVINSNIYFHILKTRLTTLDVAGFKVWLAAQHAAGTPVTVVYQLATPTRTPLTFTLNNASTAPELPLDFLTDTPSADYPATIFSAEGEVIVRGRNLFNAADFADLSPMFYKYDGIILHVLRSNGNSWVLEPYSVSLSAGTYTITRTNTVGTLQLRTSEDNYAANKVQLLPGEKTKTFTLSNDASIKLKEGTGAAIYPLYSKIQIELGSVSTAYEPYRTPQTAPFPTLRSINDIKDEFDVLTGKVTRRMSDWVTLDGSKNWNLYNGFTINRVRVFLGVSGLNPAFNVAMYKYNGVKLTNGNSIDQVSYGGSDAYALLIGIGINDSGWSLNPNSGYIKAYFHGWKMCHSDGASPYYKSEVPYNPDTWAEWVVGSSVVANTSGLEYTVNEYGSATAGITAPIRPNINYGFIIDVVSSDGNIKLMVDVAGHYFQGSQVERQISDIPGKYKVLLTSLSSIDAQNPLRITQVGTAGIGNKIKIKDIRLFELPPGSQIEADFNNLSADALAIKYKFYGENPKHWKRLVGTEAEIRNSITSTLPTESYDGFTPYRMIYELETPVIEQLEPTELKTYPHTTIAEVNNDTPAKAEITATVKTVDLN